jgi:hypothetical protein
MMRFSPGAVAVLAICAATPALAADYVDYPQLRPSYPQGWENGEDSIRFEAGARYWYSWGGQDAGFDAAPFGSVDLQVRDQSHIGELHGKIEDLSTQTYVAARGGLSLHTSGTYDISPAGSGDIGRNSHIGYVGADFGWLPLGTMENGFAFGGLVGYHYWKDAPDIGTGQYATAFDAGFRPTALGEARDDFDVHALRLGVRGTADFDMFDLQAEVAAVPYAQVSGTVGGSSPGGYDFGVAVNENAPTTLTGRGHGVMAEGLVGFHPTENVTIRLGGRAWYLEGELDAVFDGTAAGIGPLGAMTLPSTYASLFRYGLMAELTGRF